MKRVVVTGAAGLSPLGCNWPSIRERFRSKQSGISLVEEYTEYENLKTRAGGKVDEGQLPTQYDRKRLRSMSRGAVLSVRATETALETSGLLGNPVLENGQTGIAYGSCLGGADMLMRLGGAWLTRNTKGLLASSYVQVLSHCCAANISLFFKIRGRMIPTCSACTSGSQAIGYSFEAIREGYQTVMLAGGAEELCVGLTGLFDAVGAASPQRTLPLLAPRPFDEDRDGLVISEGAGTLILEELSHAQARNAPIVAEVVGFATNCDGCHITNPDPEQMQRVMLSSLENAKLRPEDISVIHAHATATELGDIAESQAVKKVFGSKTPITATKSYQGHTLGATGALESWFAIEMLKENWFAPILNLNNVDPRCADLDYLTGSGRTITGEYAMVNNFAFGGVNTSLIFRRWS